MDANMLIALMALRPLPQTGHGMVPSDWDIYIQFLKPLLHPEK
jgi:hypothetical protein